MNITKYATENPQVTVVAFIFLLMIGLRSFLTMPQYENPLVQPPGAVIVAIYPGASPSDLESLVVDVLEESVYELDNLEKMDTEIENGIAIIDIEFSFDSDPDDKFSDVQAQVNSVTGQLPSGLYSLEVRKKSTSDVFIFQMMLSSDPMNYKILEEEAEKIKDAVEGIDGLKSVKIDAYPEQQVRIALDPVRMFATNVSLDNIENAIVSNNTNIPGGNLRISSKSFAVQTSGFYQNLDEIKRTVVGTNQGQNVYLEDVATVYLDHEDERYLARLNGRPGIMLSIQQNENVNIHTVSKAIKKKVASVKLRPETALNYVFEQHDQVTKNVNGFLSNLFQGIVLVGLIVWIVLGGRPSLLVMVAIPLSIFMGLTVVDKMELGLQQISIAGLVIALGLLVDNSIVITENIERYLSMGKSRKEAAIKGAGELGAALISATLTTCLAFIPIITMPDKTGDFIRSMPITVISTLVASLLIAFTLTPFVASRLFKEGASRKQTWLAKKLEGFANSTYERIQRWIFGHKWITLGGVLAFFALSVFIFTQYVDQSFFPKTQKPQFRVTITLPPGSSLEATDEVTRQVEAVLDSIPSVKYAVSNVGHGNPQIYYNVSSENFKSHFAEIFVTLDAYEETSFEVLISHLRNRLADIGEGRVDVREFVQGVASKAPLEVKIYGDKLERLQELSTAVENELFKHPAAINIENPLSRPSTDLKIEIFKEKAAMLGVPVIDIDKAIRTFLAGRDVSDYRDQNSNQYDIVLRYDTKGKDFATEDFEKVYVKSLGGSFIPLLNLAKLSFQPGESQIEHTMAKRSTSVLSGIADGYVLSEVASELSEQFKQINWGECSYGFAGDLQAQSDSFGGLTVAAGFALLLCLLVLIIQFKSFRQPMIVLTALPFGVIGAILFLFLFGKSFSFMAFVGLISLIGIAINNSIVLIEFSNQELDKGKTVMEAAINGGRIRLVPILATTLTTILGLIPLAVFGGSLWLPMCLVIIGGMITSTILILLCVPLIYSMLSGKRS